MRSRIRPGISGRGSDPGKVAASTFVELLATMLLLVLFASLAFPLLRGATRAGAAHDAENAVLQSRLSLATLLPRLTEEVRPPYWENPEKVFAGAGDEYRVAYGEGEGAFSLILRKDGDSRLILATSNADFMIDELPGLDLDWWKEGERIIGIRIRWRQDGETAEFHAAWASFPL
jgi:hypothetical protein